MRRRDLLGGLSLVPLAVPAVAQCVLPGFPRINLADRCESGGGSSPPPPPAVDLSFTTPGTLDPRVTLTRASTATYVDSAGIVQTAAINAPRWDYDQVTLQLRGLLLEDQSTNLFLQSGDVSNASWTKFQNGGAAVPVVTGNAQASPTGAVTAASVVYPAVASGALASSLRQNVTVTATQYAFSVFLKGAVGGEQLYLCITQDAVTYTRQRFTLTNTWQRYTLTTGTLAAATQVCEIGTDLRDTSQTATPAQTVYVWGAQIEAKTFPTSYIPTTTAAATRSLEVCNMTGTNFSSWFTGAAGSVVEEVSFPSVVSGMTTRLSEFSDGTTANFLTLIPTFGASYTLSSTIAGVAGVSLTLSGATTAGTVMRLGYTYGTTRTGVVNGGAVVSTPGGIAPLVNQLQFGNRPDGLRGGIIHMRRMQFWPTALSDAELRYATT